MNGMLFLIVGPSGAGKDTLLDGARERLAGDRRFVFARRVITRPADAGGEAHESVNSEEFDRRLESGAFLSHWRAHDLSYGLPIELEADLAAGRHVLANVSRAVIADIAGRYPTTRVVEITAAPQILAARLAARGRETAADVARRLARTPTPYPPGVEVLTVLNDETPEQGIERFIRTLIRSIPGILKVRKLAIDTWHENVCILNRACTSYAAPDYLGTGKVDISNDVVGIRAKVNLTDDIAFVGVDEIGLSRHAFEELGLPEGAEITLERTPSPSSISALRAKLSGSELTLDQMQTVIRDIAEDRYSEKEIAAFLVAASRDLSVDEVQSLTRARAEFAHSFSWGREIVADKHSMGGIPGSRITMIVIPIVAAHGLLIPKTSSRAITSAAGTADAMETIARVDLLPEEVGKVVAEANGCIAWNGRLNHSPVDDVMNSITRPLGIDSTKWAVASILSKKLAAGATHVIIDIPVGPYAKVQQGREGRELSRLFEEVGAGVGLKVTARLTDGSRPIGRGIGPALEVRDVFKVLENAKDAPEDLKEKALGFAASILEWDPTVGRGQGRRLAGEILSSGRARQALERIVDLQGRREKPDKPGDLVHEVVARNSGVIGEIDSYRISGIARRAGAPMDKSAGVDLIARLGDNISAGDPLYLIHANVETDFRIAVDAAEQESGFKTA